MSQLKYLEQERVTPAISQEAVRILHENFRKPWGTTVAFSVDGREYVARIERHWHDPKGTIEPKGPHTGCSVLYYDEASPDTQPDGSRPRFKFSPRSLKRLEGVDERIVRVVRRAIDVTPIDFTIVCGRRTTAEQAACVASGASETMNSRHLTGHAVDVAPWINGAISWAWGDFHTLAPVILRAAEDLAVPLEWGGNWTAPHRADGPHFQIPWGK